MKLYLVQHGESEAKEVNVERPLNARGVSDVNKVAMFLKGANLKLGAVYHSGKRRAEETARIIADVIGLRCNIIKRDDLSPNDSIQGIVKEIAETKEDLMIVGHLPFLEKLVSWLLVGEEEKATIKFRQGGIVCLKRIEDDSWQIDWFMIPELL